MINKFIYTVLILLNTIAFYAQSEPELIHDELAVEEHLIGKDLYILGDFKNAIIHFSNSINIDPTIDENYISRGNAYRELNQLDLAEKDFLEVIKIRPDLSYMAYNNIGNLYKRRNEPLKAIEFFEKSIDANKFCFDCFYNAGLSYAKISKHEKAIDSFQKATKINSNYSNSFYNMANSYFALKKYNEAIQNYSIALDLNPNNTNEIVYNRGMCYANIENFSMARKDFETFTLSIKNNADAFYNLALACYRLSDFNSSCANAKKSLSFGKTEAQVFIDETCK